MKKILLTTIAILFATLLCNTSAYADTEYTVYYICNENGKVIESVFEYNDGVTISYEYNEQRDLTTKSVLQQAMVSLKNIHTHLASNCIYTGKYQCISDGNLSKKFSYDSEDNIIGTETYGKIFTP